MSSDAGELKKLVKQLQNASAPAEITSILQLLKKFQVNEAILRESKAGLAVGKLRQHASRDVSDAAKDIVKKWKTEVERAKADGGSSSAATKGGKPAAVRKASIASAASSAPSPNGSKSDVRTLKSDEIAMKSTGDNTRDKCVELIYDALASDSASPSELIAQRASAIESAVLNAHGSTTTQYKSKIRSLFVNLKDKNNPDLRESVVSGDITAEQFAKMSSQDMASAERKAADRKIMEENLHNSLGAGEQSAETDAFQCSRCKQRKCRYRQAQTRSADEPMTTFVTCTVCNNRWKFS